MNKKLIDCVDCIRTRRSIRSFLPKRVSKSDLTKIVFSGLAAPSSKNSNPWFFVVVETKKQREQIIQWIREGIRQKESPVPIDARTGKKAKGSFDTVEESIQTISEASALIIVFNRGPFSGGCQEVIDNPRGGRALYTYASEIIGVGAAIQNILLAAHAIGLGAVYMADPYPARIHIQKALKTECEMLGTIAVGYPAYSLSKRRLHKEFVADWYKAKGKITKEEICAEKF